MRQFDRMARTRSPFLLRQNTPTKKGWVAYNQVVTGRGCLLRKILNSLCMTPGPVPQKGLFGDILRPLRPLPLRRFPRHRAEVDEKRCASISAIRPVPVPISRARVRGRVCVAQAPNNTPSVPTFIAAASCWSSKALKTEADWPWRWG
jgi:hypothetical protein